MTAAQGAAYCSKLSQTYAEYVGTVGGYLGGATTGGQAADLDARVAIAQCQDGNYASGIPVLQQKLRDARVTVPPPPTCGLIASGKENPGGCPPGLLVFLAAPARSRAAASRGSSGRS